MPVRSSLCAYSPAATSATMGTSATSKYSAILPTASSLSYGHYKPLGGHASSPTPSRVGSFRATSSHYERPTLSSPSGVSTATTLRPRSSFTSRYSTSSYSPTNSAGSSSTSSTSAGLYKPLEATSSRNYGGSLGSTASGSRRFSSSSNSLGQHDSNYLGPYSAYKSPSSSASSAYSSGSSLASTSSGLSSTSTSTSSSVATSGYVPRSRRLSYTDFGASRRPQPEPPAPPPAPKSPPKSPQPLSATPQLTRTPSSSRTSMAPSCDPVDGCGYSTKSASSPPFELQSYSTTSSLGSQRSSPGVTELGAASPSSPSSRRSPASALSASAATKSPPLPAGVPAGLINLGNTCYMNATLQALYSIAAFREPILSGALRTGDKVLASQLADLFKLLHASNATGQPVSPADFKYAFSSYQSKFSGFAQQDAQEFLRYLINGVHEEFNRVRQSGRRSHQQREAPRSAQEAWAQYREIVDDSPLVDLLVGQLCSTITCSECHNKSHCWDPFWDLSLPLLSQPGSLYSARSQQSLRDILDEFTAKETLDKDERPSCQHCKKATRSTKQISFARLPQVLILHLKKFTNDGYKLSSSDISIDKQLTFSSAPGATYRLRAAISHHGHSSSSGHYTSHCDYNSRWFHFDDARVRDVTGQFEPARLSDAYVLLYTPTTSPSVHSKL